MTNLAESRFAQSPRQDAFVQAPYPTYDRMRPGPVWWAEYDMWCLTSHADVSRALRDRRLGREVLHVATREELGWDPVPDHLAPHYLFERNTLLEREPPAHTRLRRLVNRAFTSRAIAGLEGRIADLSRQTLSGLRGEVDLIEAYATPVPLTIITELLGAPLEAADQMLAWSHDMVAIYQARRDRAVEDRAVAATIAFSDFMAGVIAKRRAAPGNALIDDLIAAEDDGETLSHDELIATCILLMNAGHEATVHAIGNTVKAVLEHNVPRQVFAGPEGARAADEGLRFDAPLHMFTRFVLEDLGDYGPPLKRGETIGLILGAANRDPAQFPAPDRFDPDRANAASHVSLGAGIHFCVGAPLARLELRIALAALFDHAPGLTLTEPPRFADRYHFHGLDRLMVDLGP